MEFTLLPRAGGKSWQLAYTMRVNANAGLLVFSQRELDRMEALYPWLVGRVATYERHHALSGRCTEIYIDNVDLILKSLFGNVTYATATGRQV